MLSNLYCTVATRQCLRVLLHEMWTRVICYELQLPCLWDILNHFSNNIFDFYSYKIKLFDKEQSIKLCIHNGVDMKLWDYFTHVRSCERLHFLTYYMSQNNKKECAVWTGNYLYIFDMPQLHFICNTFFF